MKDEMGWRPIDTAPKDGTVIDLWVDWPDREGGRLANAKWTDDHASKGKIGFDWIGPDRFPLAAYVAKPKATHWMPLPSPPQEPSNG